MEHNLFKSKSFEEGRNSVVGDCNGIPMDVRYREETPVFARKIYSLVSSLNRAEIPIILDYGCGVGRLAKEILKQDQHIRVIGTDASGEMRNLALNDINSERFVTKPPQELEYKFDLAYLVYVLQHIPSIEIREALCRIHYHLKDDGYLFYCSSDYRMCIRFDGAGFFDDRFLGVNLQEELSRYFDLVGNAFTDEELKQNEVVYSMVTGINYSNGEKGLAHPALIYKKKKIEGQLFNATLDNLASERLVIDKINKAATISSKTPPQKLILIQKQSPGDILMATVALRDLHKAYPGEYLTDMRTPCQEIFYNNPYITPIVVDDVKEEHRIIEELKADDKHKPIKYGDIIFCNLHYPMVHEESWRGTHFADAMPEFLSQQLDRPIKRTGLRPEIYLDQNETNWLSPVAIEAGYADKYWVINAGVKSDFTLKQYPYYQEVVDLLKDKIKFVQIGQKAHLHTALEGVIDMRGKTDLRQLFRVIYKAEGVLTCVSLPMHVAAAFEKPCVVISGAREGARWEYYSNHRFLCVNGCLSCASWGGCWLNTIKDCKNVIEGVPLCMKMIKPYMVADSINLYYEGGILT